MSEHYSNLHKSHLSDKDLRILNALKCLRLIKPYRPMQSVVDFGCGIGGWLVAAKQLGATRVLGIEGDWVNGNGILIDAADLQIADLVKDALSFDRSFDVALSIEVGEHLPAASADILCDNMVGAANFLVFSAAIIGQTGINHINEQKPRYWVDKFWDRGFVPLELFRPAIIREPRMYSWLKQNLMAFVNYDMLHLQPDLVRFALPRQHFYTRYCPM